MTKSKYLQECKYYKEYKGLHRPKCSCVKCWQLWIIYNSNRAAKYIIDLRDNK